ncbi:DUF2306 domain-containing protein [Cohnella hashimotonis]|uniref:DUF2306 domain-containing protein n=1 Tax=Cohnella hashimotonis TaxID=2826895 RepID=A0ABT6TV46_9BACL|nr:DUF2306 domain-containing protein [Cohnella hashimotonis]MDI4649809.1 DUF2306 domain-containing protein [Cohnella hashimotonis]
MIDKPYRLVIVLSAGLVAWTLLNRFAIDPGAVSFLSHKTGIAHQLRLPAWLRVLDIHIAFACLALLAGALNFANPPARGRRRRHRSVGYAYIISVLGVCITSGYMAPYATGGRPVSMAFNLLNLIWIAVTVTALVQIRRRQVVRHRQWMIRSYAFCFTNVTIHLAETVLTRLLGMRYETAYAVSVYATILILIAIAELIVRRTAGKPQKTGTFTHQ